jgi:phosphate transport system substrate-binding protein
MRIRITVLIAIFLFGSCSAPMNTSAEKPMTVRIKGSDSMLLLVQRLADQFMQQQAGIPIAVEGGGSGAGIQALIDGSIEICATSRPLRPDEVRLLAQRYRSIGVSILSAKDALNIVVHPSNAVASLSLQQLVDIFTGVVTNWKEVGGADLPITVYGRESNSGTYLYFEEHVLLGAEYTDECEVVPGARALISAVTNDPAAISYSTSAYAGQVKSVAIGGVLPTAENVRNGSYPVTRYLYFYTVHQPEGTIKQFLDWVVSKEGQRVSQANGYTPLYSVE